MAGQSVRALHAVSMPPAEMPAISGTTVRWTRGRRGTLERRSRTRRHLEIGLEQLGELDHELSRLEEGHRRRRDGVREVEGGEGRPVGQARSGSRRLRARRTRSARRCRRRRARACRAAPTRCGCRARRPGRTAGGHRFPSSEGGVVAVGGRPGGGRGRRLGWSPAAGASPAVITDRSMVCIQSPCSSVTSAETAALAAVADGTVVVDHETAHLARAHVVQLLACSVSR